MPIGGFNGSDPSPTLAEFQQYVAAGHIHYYIGGGFGGQVAARRRGHRRLGGGHFTPTTVGGVVLYDLTATRAKHERVGRGGCRT